MFNISKEKFGVQFAFSGKISLDEMKQWSEKARVALSGLPKGFGVLIDNRELVAGGIQPDALEVLIAAQLRHKQAGMARSCVVLSSAAVNMQFERAARSAGIFADERYVNAAKTPEWRQKSLNWIERGVDPFLS
jgi:hypothetical protein